MRRLGVPALVLAPHSAIQGQWRNVGPTTLLFAHRGEGRDARAAAEAEHADFDVQVREVWV